MKRLSLLVVAVALVCTACGATPEAFPPPATADTTASSAADPAPIVDGDVTVGRAGGVDVIVKKVPGAAFAATHIYMRGGARNWTAADAGIEQLTLSVAAWGGTAALDKTAWARKLASLGAQIYPDVRADFSALDMKVPVSAWDEGFGLLVSAFRSPALPPSEVDVRRTRMLATLHHEDEDPDSHTRMLMRKQVFAGHPYVNPPLGTLDSVAAIKPDALAPHLDRLRVKSRLLVVAVGDLDPAHVFDQIRRALGDLPAGNYVETPLPPLSFDAPSLVTEKRVVPTNYCRTAFPAPRPTDADYVVGGITMNVLDGRIGDEVRTKRNLSYAADAYLANAFAIPYAHVYVSAVDPNAAMKVILDQMRRLAEEPIPAEELAGYKAVFLTDYLIEREIVEWQAADLATAQLYGKDWRIARTIPDRARAVGPADIQAYAKRYFTHGKAVVLGDPAKVDRALFTSL